jgi:hypothetical protein
MGVFRFDRQLIVQFLTGTGDDIITEGTAALEAVATIPTEVLTIRPTAALIKGGLFARFELANLVEEMKVKMGRLTQNSRVYLRGHSDWKNCLLADFDAAIVAKLTAEAGMPRVRLVSILGCSLARDVGSDPSRRVLDSANSFASEYHAILKKKYEIKTFVAARTFPLAIGIEADIRGVKFTGARKKGIPMLMNQPHSKILFYWDGDRQMRLWADYTVDLKFWEEV